MQGCCERCAGDLLGERSEVLGSDSGWPHHAGFAVNGGNFRD